MNRGFTLGPRGRRVCAHVTAGATIVMLMGSFVWGFGRTRDSRQNRPVRTEPPVEKRSLAFSHAFGSSGVSQDK